MKAIKKNIEGQMIYKNGMKRMSLYFRNESHLRVSNLSSSNKEQPGSLLCCCCRDAQIAILMFC